MNTDWLTTLYGLPWDTAGQIALAGLLGGTIGFERAWHGHAAGLRTTSLVAVGSCLFTILSITAFPVHGNTQDTARIAAQVVSGIGFIGAGVLIQSKNRIRGITTAATIWLVAAIGMAVGTGVYFLAIFTTLFCTAILILLHPVSAWLLRRARQNRKKLEEQARADAMHAYAESQSSMQ
jgi:putative Mg2+ transporter-C (MgtC) family protein